MVIDLDTEDGRIVVALASLGAMLAGVQEHLLDRANVEIPAAVMAFQAKFHHDRVTAVLKRIVDYYVKRN
jgi:hypothetical protein